MPDAALRIFPDEFVPSIQASDGYKRWVKSSPGDLARWTTFRDALLAGQTPPIPVMSTKLGQALVAAGKEHMSISSLVGQVTNPYPPPDPPPPGPPPVTLNPYWYVDFRGGRYAPGGAAPGASPPGLFNNFVFYSSGVSDPAIKSWGGLESNLYDTTRANGGSGPYLALDPAQRVHLRTTPAPPRGPSTYVSRQEIRASDPAWYSGQNYDKASIRSYPTDSFGGAFSQGSTRWFAWDYFIPLNYGADNDTFNFSSGWHTLMDIHGTGNNYSQNWNVLEAVVVSYSGARWVAYHMGAHEDPADPLYNDIEYVQLAQLTDAGGNRITASYNVWHELVVGVKFASDGTIGSSTGWVELWHDGVNVLPQHSRPTCFPNETWIWQQAQNYKQHSSAFVSGTNSVMYYGGMRAGMARADVQAR